MNQFHNNREQLREQIMETLNETDGLKTGELTDQLWPKFKQVYDTDKKKSFRRTLHSELKNMLADDLIKGKKIKSNQAPIKTWEWENKN